MPKHLSVTGIGPYYVSLIAVLTLLSYFGTKFNYLPYHSILENPLLIIIIGILLIILGIYIWACAFFKAKIGKNILDNHLVTDGIYAWVRNPIYTAFMFVAWGLILLINNLYLLPLCLLYWLILTLMLKPTEEKWLKELYGQAYIDYMQRVNRCIPWFPKH